MIMGRGKVLELVLDLDLEYFPTHNKKDRIPAQSSEDFRFFAIGKNKPKIPKSPRASTPGERKALRIKA